MTTATANRPPTEAEIREALQDRLRYMHSGDTTPRANEPNLHAQLRGIAEDYAQAIREAAWIRLFGAEGGFDDEEGPEDGPWVDLRPSEARRLWELTEAAIARAVARCDEAIRDELTGAAMTFAREHPDAPTQQATRKAAAA